MRVLTILARHGTEHYPGAEEAIAAIFARQMPDVDRVVIVVDNALPGELIEERPGRVLLGGDNRSFEFSAFDRAIAWAGARLDAFDLVHFATSAFQTLYTAYLERFTPPVLRAIGPRPACLGHIDCYNEPIELMQCRSQHWIRTGFFLLPPREVRLLGAFAGIPDGTAFFSGDPRAPFRADAPLSARYRTLITDWLAGSDIGQGVAWHSSFGLTPDTLPSFERKARSIMTEQWLGIRLRALGCPLIDVTWLSAQLARTRGGGLDWRTPWRAQLAGRDRDALHVADSAPAGPLG